MGKEKTEVDTFDEKPEVESEGIEILDFDFEDEKPERFKFKLPEHYHGKPVYGNVSCSADGFFTFVGTRKEVGPVGRILTRFYGAKLVK